MDIIEVTEDELAIAGSIHAAAWRESHKAFCSETFVAAHTAERQTEYLRGEIEKGKRLWLLRDGEAVGIITVDGSLIENLYVHPDVQRKGYGTQLLRFGMGKCSGTPCLWILNNNQDALRLYERHGFRLTGRSKRLSDTLSELEMSWNTANDCTKG